MRGIIHTRAHVIALSRRHHDKMKDRGRDDAPFLLRVTLADGSENQFEARAVIDASGTWQQSQSRRAQTDCPRSVKCSGVSASATGYLISTATREIATGANESWWWAADILRSTPCSIWRAWRPLCRARQSSGRCAAQTCYASMAGARTMPCRRADSSEP